MNIYFFEMAIKIAGSALKSRVGRVSGNTVCLGLIKGLYIVPVFLIINTLQRDYREWQKS